MNADEHGSDPCAGLLQARRARRFAPAISFRRRLSNAQ